jgi:hypothetical protein
MSKPVSLCIAALLGLLSAACGDSSSAKPEPSGKPAATSTAKPTSTAAATASAAPKKDDSGW